VAKRGDWVKVHSIVLKAEERSSHLPEDTKKVPLEMWINGFLAEDAKLGENVEITTLSGRMVKGTLVEVNPRYTHDFGEPIPELLRIGPSLKRILEED